MTMEYKLIWLILMVAVTLKCQKIENLSTSRGQTRVRNRMEVFEEVFLKRQKRFVIFQQGAAMTFQGNIAKSIILGVPRGLNEITEYTLTYDLPWNIENLRFAPPKKPAPVKSPARNTTNGPNQKGGVENKFVQKTWKPIKKLWCPREHVFQKYYNFNRKNSQPFCVEYKSKYAKRRQKRQNISGHEDTPKGTTMLFDIITHLANMHGLNARHCIMRTLCESQHLLLPPGRLLFHDLVRILLSYAHPATQRHAPFRDAIHRENLQECMKLYGLHCRWSFLQHFTESIATAANSMAI